MPNLASKRVKMCGLFFQNWIKLTPDAMQIDYI